MAKKSAAGPIITRRFQLSFPRASQVPARARERARASMAWRARARVLELVPVLMASQARERQVLRAQVQIHIKLVARQLPAVRAAGDECDRPGIHQVQLHIRIRLNLAKYSFCPVVADQAHLYIELCGKEFPALTVRRPADNFFDHTVISRGGFYAINPGFQFAGG